MPFKVFIGSSGKSESYVTALHADLEKQKINGESIERTPWTHAFDVGDITVNKLLDHARGCDAAVFIFAKDDFVVSDPRKQSGCFVTRDNVILELGMFMGRLGLDRAFFAIPKEHKDLHLPTDLSGVTWVQYNSDRSDDNKAIAMQECCDSVVKKLRIAGQRTSHARTVHLHRTEIKWSDFEEKVAQKFWACGTSLSVLVERDHLNPLEHFWKNGVRDIRLLLPSTAKDSASLIQLRRYNDGAKKRPGRYLPDQVQHAQEPHLRLKECLSALPVMNLQKHLRRYKEIMFSNITIMDDDAIISFYNCIGAGNNNITLHVKKAEDPKAYERITEEFEMMWKAAK